VRSGDRQKHVVGSELEFERIQLELDSQGHSKVRVDLPAKSSSKSNNMHQRRQIRKEQPEIHKDKPINGSLPELHSQNASLIHNEERDFDKDKPINRSLSALHSQRFLIHNESSRKPATCIVKLYGTKNCESTLRQTIEHSAPTKYMLSGAEKKIQSAWLGGYCGPVIFEDDDKYLRRDDFTCNSGCCTWSWDLANDVK